MPKDPTWSGDPTEIYSEKDLVGESNGLPVRAGNLAAKGYQQITSLSAATALTVPNGARLALIQAESKDVRWRDDGTNPTASVGMLITAGETIEYAGSLSALRFIESSASAKLNVAYYD